MNRSHKTVLPGLIALSGLAIAALIGLLIAGNFGEMLLALFSVAIAVPGIYFIARRFTDRSGWLLLAGWLVMLAANSVQYLSEVPIGYAHEFILFGMALVIAQRVWRTVGQDTALKVIVILWFAYMALTLLSSVLGRSQFLPAIWQLQYNMKWPLMFGLGMLIVWGAGPERQLQKIILFSWLFLAACVLFEIAAPCAHRAVFGPTPDMHTNPLLGFGLRYRGPFSHSGYLALISALLCAAAFAQTLAGRGRAWLILAGIYFGLGALAGQRQEMIALIATLLLFVAMHFRRHWYLLLGVAVLGVVTTIAALVLLQHLPMREMLEQSGILASTQPYAERTILTIKGASVASQFFPLGSGLGTYGGVGAMKFDQSLFLEMGFRQYWWFRQGTFLVDTFWPSVIAESGYFGAALLAISLLSLWLTMIRRTLHLQDSSPLYGVGLTAVAALTLMLLNSPSSAALTDPRSCFLFWLLVGSAWQATVSAPKVTRVLRSLNASTRVASPRIHHAS